ncbi:hypothetical protein KIL84_014384 [Mauremys mutica]|uniref:Uncharacterized protein n=1 Tax=Mauremys mutica TaxID=74926 RepID=A0A9D3XPM3_9SAUR|nr:hypothetical protein KIL84_014384 [Mauremys mutica]
MQESDGEMMGEVEQGEWRGRGEQGVGMEGSRRGEMGIGVVELGGGRGKWSSWGNGNKGWGRVRAWRDGSKRRGEMERRRDEGIGEMGGDGWGMEGWDRGEQGNGMGSGLGEWREELGERGGESTGVRWEELGEMGGVERWEGRRAG